MIFPLPIGTWKLDQGFFYRQNERERWGWADHSALDFNAPYATPIFAAAEGFAVCFYQRGGICFDFRQEQWDHIRLEDGKPIGFGAGYIVQIYHPESICHIKGGRVTQYGHLSQISSLLNARFLPPQVIDFDAELAALEQQGKLGGSKGSELARQLKHFAKIHPWYGLRYGMRRGGATKEEIEIHLWTHEEIQEEYSLGNPHITYVKRGDIIGYVGNSGVIIGDLKYVEATHDVHFRIIPEQGDCPSHLHFVEFSRNNDRTGVDFRDPLGIYSDDLLLYQPQNLTQSLFIDYP